MTDYPKYEWRALIWFTEDDIRDWLVKYLPNQEDALYDHLAHTVYMQLKQLDRTTRMNELKGLIKQFPEIPELAQRFNEVVARKIEDEAQ